MESNTNEASPIDVSHTLNVCTMMLNGCKANPIRISSTADENERNDFTRYRFSCQCVLIAYCIIKSIMEHEDTIVEPDPFLRDLDAYVIKEFAGLIDSCTMTIIRLTDKYLACEHDNNIIPASIDFGNPLGYNIEDLSDKMPSLENFINGVARVCHLIDHLETMKHEVPEKWFATTDGLIQECRKVLMLYRAGFITMTMKADNYDGALSSLRAHSGDILAIHYTYNTAKRMEEEIIQKVLITRSIATDGLAGEHV